MLRHSRYTLSVGRIKCEPYQHVFQNKPILAFSIFSILVNKKFDHTYWLGLLQNIALQQHVYPEWKVLVYVDKTSHDYFPDWYDKYLVQILEHFPSTLILQTEWTINGVDPCVEHPDLQFVKTMWRFIPATYTHTFSARDADSRLNIREEAAVREWQTTNKRFYRIFDDIGNDNPLLAGMWGARSTCSGIVRGVASCQRREAAIPAMEMLILRTISNLPVEVGYGIDEWFLAEFATSFTTSFHQDLITFGTGSFYSGNITRSLGLFENNLKIGRSMPVLPACTSPYTISDSDMLRDVSFVGEPIRIGTLDHDVYLWLIHQTIHPNANLAECFKRFDINWCFDEFWVDMRQTTVLGFIAKYKFDKRILSCFWYCFLYNYPDPRMFVNCEGSVTPSELARGAYLNHFRQAVHNHPHTHSLMFQELDIYSFRFIQDGILRVMTGVEDSEVILRKVNLTPIFKDVYDAIQKYAFYSLLSPRERFSFWYVMIHVYPPTALYKFSIPF